MNVVSKFIYRTKEYGLKYVLQTIVRNKIFTRIEVLNDTIGSFLFKRIPLKETIILESHNDFDSNGGAFYDYLIKHNFNEKYKIVMMQYPLKAFPNIRKVMESNGAHIEIKLTGTKNGI